MRKRTEKELEELKELELESLRMAADAKYIDYLLGTISNGADSLTLSQIRSDFNDKFALRDENGTIIQKPHCMFPNQYTALLSLLPVIWLHEAKDGKNVGEKTLKQIKLIRHAMAHGNVQVSRKNGFIFKTRKHGTPDLVIPYDKFPTFLTELQTEVYKHYSKK